MHLLRLRLPSALAQAARRSLSSLSGPPSVRSSPPRAPVPELAFSPPSDAPLPRMPVVLRSSVGSRAAQWARRNGYVPGMVYGGAGGDGGAVAGGGGGGAGGGGGGGAGGPPQAAARVLTLSREEDLRREISARKTSFLNTLYAIELAPGRVEVCLPRDVQLHPFRQKIISVNWLRYRPGRHPGVKLGLPLVPLNEERSPGLREGGWLLELMLKVPVFVHGHDIPDALYLDLRSKRVGDKIMASELDLAPGVVLRSRERDFAVAKILGSRKGAGGAAAAEGEEGEGEKAKVKVNEKVAKKD